MTVNPSKYRDEVLPDLNGKTNNLSIGERQQVELLRLLYNGAKLIILDEPTSAFFLEQKKKDLIGSNARKRIIQRRSIMNQKIVQNLYFQKIVHLVDQKQLKNLIL